MVATRTQVEAYRVSSRLINDLIDADIQSAMSTVPRTISGDALRDFLIGVGIDLAARYGPVAVTLAAEFYQDTMARRAVLADQAPVEKIQASARWAASPGFVGGENRVVDLEKVASRLGAFTKRNVKTLAGETIARSTFADPRGAGWARVPAGTETCAWCLMLASRGFVYATKQTAGGVDRDHYHGDCDCVAVPALPRESHPYHAEVDRMYGMYKAVHEKYDTDADVAAKLRKKFGLT